MSRILIVEDDPDDRSFLVSCVEAHSDLRLAACVTTCAEGIECLGTGTIDGVVLDLALPDGSGLQVLEHARELGLPVLIMTILGDEATVAEAIANGASGYLLKDSDADTIAESIVRVLNGESPINPRVARYLLDRVCAEEPERIPDDAPVLTPAELRVLELVARGYTYKECAEELHRSAHTITTHIKNIYEKLAVGSRAEAVSRAFVYKLLDAGDLEDDFPGKGH